MASQWHDSNWGLASSVRCSVVLAIAFAIQVPLSNAAMDVTVDPVGPDDLLVLDGDILFDEPDPFSPVTVSASTLEMLAGTITLQATNSITVNEAVTFMGGNDLTLQAGGDITLNAAVTGANNLALTADAGFAGFPSDGSGIVTVTPSLTAAGLLELDAGTEIVLSGADYAGAGLSLGASASLDLAANQLLDAGAGTMTVAGSLTKSTGGNLTLSAGVGVDSGGDLSVSGGDLTVASNITLTGGSQSLSATSGSLTLGGSLTKNNLGDVTLSGGTSVILGSTSLSAGALTVNGNLDLNGSSVTTAGNQTYNGDVTLSGDTTFTVIAPGSITIDGIFDPVPAAPSTTIFEGGDVLVIFLQKIMTEIGPGGLSLASDTLQVNGTISLGAALEVDQIDGYRPSPGDEAEIITATTVNGAFSDVIFKAVPGEIVTEPDRVFVRYTCLLADDFESYLPDSELHGQGGWKGWDNDPAFSAPVSATQAHSGAQSVKIEGTSHLVQETCSGESGTWSYTVWQYIPGDFVSGGVGADAGSYLSLYSLYSDGGAKKESVRMQADSNGGVLRVYQGDGSNTVEVPYDTDRWVKIQTIVDLDNDWTQIYYDDDLVTEYQWTGGIIGDGGGVLGLLAIDFDAKSSSVIFYDDLDFDYCDPDYDFEVFEVSGLQEQSGWKGWDNDLAFDAPVTQDQARSGVQSAAIAGSSNLVHETCSMQNSLYSVSAWQYIPGDFASGGAGPDDGTYFALLNTYTDGGPYDWSTQLQFDSNDGLLKAWHGDGNNRVSVPYDTDRWVKIQTIVDLEDDWTRVYYDDELVTEYPWTGGIIGGGGGALDIAAVDLYANQSSVVYYDDTRLLRCELSDDFEPYDSGSELHGLGGWEGWDNDPAFSAPVTQNQAHSGVQSLDVSAAANLVHPYCTTREGVYTLSAWHYIPSAFVSGGVGDDAGSYLVVYDRYNRLGPVHEALRVQVDANIASVRISQGELIPIDVPYDTDRWVKIQAVVDLDNDWTRVYYDDALVTEYPWTGGVIGGGGGAKDIAVVDLYANGSTSIHYDDIKIERGCRLEEDFDSYMNGSQLHGQGGWKGRDNDPAATAPVTQDRAHSAPQSADISGSADLLHEFCTPLNGVYSLRAWQYIPSGFASGGEGATDGTYFSLLNSYSDGLTFEPSVQLQIDSNDGLLKAFHGDGSNTIDVPYTTDRWVKIQTIIDLDDDWTQIYYDDDLVTEYPWTGGILGGGGGANDIAAVDLYANGSSSVYYDDLVLKRGCGVGRTSDVDGDGSSVGDELVKGTDSCDPDTDGDGILDGPDNCPLDSNAGQEDCDADGLGDVCTISSGLFGDCNANATPDNCDVTPGALGFGSPIATGGGSGILGTMVVGRFTNDSHLDVALGLSADPGTVTVFTGAGDGSFLFATPTNTNVNPELRTVADVDGDNDDDIVAIDLDGSLYILPSNGDGTLAPPVLLDPPGGPPTDVAAADMDRDGDVDLVVIATPGGNPDGTVSVYFNQGGGTFVPPVPHVIDPSPQSLALGDVDRDGHTDVVVASGGTEQRLLVLLNDGAGGLSAPTPHPVGQGVQRLALADFNSDGHLDAAVTRFTTQDVAILLNDGTGSFGSAVGYPAVPSVLDIIADDFDRDGRLDVAVSHSNHYSILRGNGDGTLSAAVNITQTFVPFPGASVFGDFSEDGRPDWAGQDSSSITTLFNETPPPANQDCNANSTPDSCDLTAGESDCQGDGIPDSCQLAENDCNDDGIPDDCQLADNDCNSNDLPDWCDLDDDGDGVPTDCDQCQGFDDNVDTDGDTVPNGCDLCEGFDDAIDDDQDSVPNGCDICAGGDDTVDTDNDTVPDDCDQCAGFDDTLDDDDDTVPNGCDLCEGFDDSIDDDQDSVPNGCDICAGGDDTVDTDSDSVPDFCDQCQGFDDTIDTDDDTVPNGCDQCEGFDDTVDTDGDTVPDGCDQCEGFDDNVDTNGNGVPDGCDLQSPAAAAPPHDILKNRYVSIDPRGLDQINVGHDFDIRVTLTATLVTGVTAIGSEWWANPPDADCISVVGPTQPATPPNWDACLTLHLTGCPIIPTATYEIVVVDGVLVTDPPLTANTQTKPGPKWWGDCVGIFNGTEWTPPQGVTNIDDALAAIKTWQGPGSANATHVSVTDVHPSLSGTQINTIVNFDDVFQLILAFQGGEYPGPGIELCTDP